MISNLRSSAVALLAVGSLCVAAWQANTKATNGSDQPLPLVRNGPQFWKGNLHTHSLWSDGDDFPEMIADWYKSRGYHFLAMSDHNILAEGDKWVAAETTNDNRRLAVSKYRARFGEGWVERRENAKKTEIRLKPLGEYRSLLEEPGKFLLVPAEEITHRFAKYPVHINAINLRDVIVPIDGESVADTIAVNLRSVTGQKKKTGWRMIAFVNHPNYGWGVRAEDLLGDELRFFEIYNGHPSVRNYGDETHPSAERLWDIALALRLGKAKLPPIFGLATDDAHNYHKMGGNLSNPGRGWVMIQAPFLTAESLIRALENGDFYATTGVTLKNVKREEDRLSLEIAAEEGVKYRTQFIVSMRDAPLDSEPRKDAKGAILPVTRAYSADIGKVIADSDSLTPSYRLTGKELYIRAKIISTKPQTNPYQKGDVETAWTQPVTP